jgi:hypothetical protein
MDLLTPDLLDSKATKVQYKVQYKVFVLALDEWSVAGGGGYFRGGPGGTVDDCPVAQVVVDRAMLLN